MNSVQFIDLPAKKNWDKEECYPEKEHNVEILLTQTYNSLLSIKDQGKPEIERHMDKIKEMLTLCASFFSETDSKGVLLITGKDREELMTAENIFNSFKKELSHAKDEKLQKLIEAITPELQLPLSPSAIEQVKRNSTARVNFLEHFDTYSSNDIYRMNDSTATNKAALASGWRSKGRVFAVNHKSELRYPAFQFDKDAKPRKVIADVIKLFEKENADWQLALWFVTPNSILSGQAPIEVIKSDPKALIDAANEELNPTLC